MITWPHFRWPVRPGTIAAVGLLVVASVALLSAIMLPMAAQITDNQSRIAEEQFMLSRFRAAASRALPTAAPHDAMARTHFLEGQTNAVIVANMQERIKTNASTFGAEFRGANVLPETSAGPLTLLGMGIQIAGSEEAVARTLHNLETTLPVLLIVNATLRAEPSIDSKPVRINAQLDIYGALWPGIIDKVN